MKQAAMVDAMTMTDPIATCSRVFRKTANKAYHDSLRMPYSKIKTHIAEILQQEGYIKPGRARVKASSECSSSTSSTGRTASAPSPAIRRISKPGLRVYAKATNLPKVLGGLGVAIISTSTGLTH